MRHRLSGRIAVSVPPAEAFPLFTPRGEREWADGWDPTFPAETPDDSEPGTVFETDAHGHRTTWLVTDRAPDRRIAYAQVVPGLRAGRVMVTLNAAQEGTEVEIVYDLTSLSEAGTHHLEQFAAGYVAFLRSWQEAIAACLRERVG